MDSAALYEPLNSVPADFDGERQYVHVIGNTVFVDDRADNDDWTQHFIGLVDGVGWWAVDVPADADDPSFGAAVDLFAYAAAATEGEWLAAGRAVQIVEWARTSKFCGRCATPTEEIGGDRSMRCPACGLVAYPRVAPAMITLVTRGEPGEDQEALLARGARFPVPMYSCLAGFVEPGEDLEGTVVREVAEEVGVIVDQITYVGSQPWPFPHSLMIGFRANYVSGDIVCEQGEILDANWYRKDALPMVPPTLSIAGRIIEQWIEEA